MFKVIVGNATKRRLLAAKESVGEERTAQHVEAYESAMSLLKEYEAKMNGIRSVTPEMALSPTTI